ncbi:MAG: excinuclease ABC subunit UvrC [Bacteroidales bacterium]
MSLNPAIIVKSLPEKPGIYQFLDASERIIYVGKAKNLKKRVASYFTKNQPGKTAVMLKRAAYLQHIVTDSESDALLLENNLIKKHQPRYNILLKDDKTYPWICLKNEPFPRIFSTRNVIKDGSAYFGPYTSVSMVKTIIDMIRQLYKPRTCNLHLTPKNILSGKFKVCLEYHIGNCKGPCTNLQTEEDYNENIRQIKSILKGNISGVNEHLRNLMITFAQEMRFEDAQIIKEKIEILSKYQSRSTVVSTTIKNVDVFALVQDSNNTYINYLKVVEGAIIQAFTVSILIKIDEHKESLLSFAITEIRQRVASDSPEIIIPFLPDIKCKGIKYTVPERGDKKKLLELAERNAVYYMLEQKKKKEIQKPTGRLYQNLEKIRKDLHLPEMPVHIECFDNSNFLGTNPVASCVVFRNGKPSKKEYRHFNIKTVKGADDYSSMEEVVYRRYKRMTDENKSLPQLVVIDGGKGQLNSAMKSIGKLGLKNKITVIGIAKKLEEIYFPGDNIPVYLDKSSYTLKLIQQIRNEAHRFGVKFHRSKRSSEMIVSELDNIKEIGPRTKQILLQHFSSTEEIRNADIQEIKELTGLAKAKIISEYFKGKI